VTNLPTKPVYIVGRRHSGTTFLDVILGSSPDIESLGEIVTGLNAGDAERMASGEQLKDSEFWNNAKLDYTNKTGRHLLADGQWLYQMSSITRFFSAYFVSLRKEGQWKRYVDLNKDLFASLQTISDGRRILDSNKEYTRALMVLKSLQDSKVIHLLRNPLAIGASHYYRVKEKGMPVGFMKKHFNAGPFLLPILMITVGLSWSVGLAAVFLLKLRYRDRILDVSYENFCNEPEKELQRIGDFLDIDVSNPIDCVRNRIPIPVGQNIGGNELRYDGSFTFIPNAQGRRYMPFHYKVGIGMCALPGYLFRRLCINTA